jgi:uroporphyrinogen decarboxylase
MTPRERFTKTLNHQEPDRVPVDVGSIGATTLLIPTYNNLKKFLNFNKETIAMNRFFQIALMDEEILQKLGVDVRSVGTGSSENYKDIELENDSFIDEWGIKCSRTKDSIYYVFEEQPLSNAATVQDIENYKFPDPIDPGRFKGLKERINYLYNETDYAIVGFGDQIFELAWYLRGAEKIFTDMYDNQKLLHALMQKITDYNYAKTEKFIDIVGDFIQVFFTGDDIASQNGPSMSIDMYRKFVKPYQKKIYEYAKKRTSAKVIYHSCGSIYDFIPDLIDIGVDGINPVQVSAYKMDTAVLKREFGKDLSFWGAIDTQRVLPFGTFEELKNEVRKRIEDLAPGGGYVLGPVHSIQPDVSPENIIKMIEYAREFGIY